MPDALCCIPLLVKMPNKFDHISVGYVQKTSQKQPKIVLSAGMKTSEIPRLQNYKQSDINETWSRYVTLNTFNIPKNEDVNEWTSGGHNQKTTRKCHEIKRILTLTSFKTSLENGKEIGIFSLPSITI